MQNRGVGRTVPYRLYVAVWAALVALTAVTVGASLLHLGHAAILAALLIASAKSTLVLLYFMHLRFEKPLFAVMILIVIGAYLVFIGLTFVDYAYR